MTGRSEIPASVAVDELSAWYADHSDRPGARKVWWRGKRAPDTDAVGRAVANAAARLHAAGLVALHVTGQAGTVGRAHVMEVV